MPLYPLAQLLEYRAAKVRELEAEYATVCTRLACAQARVEALRAHIRGARDMITSAQERLAVRVAQGGVLVGDLWQAAEYRAGQTAAIERLKADEAAATLAVQQCRTTCAETDQVLVTWRKQLAIVERHFRIFLRRTQLLEERKVEQEAADVWQVHAATRQRWGLR